MARKLTFRQLLLSVLALWHDRSHKELAAAAGMTHSSVTQLLGRARKREIQEEPFERLLAATQCPPAAVRIVTACLEGLEALERPGDLTPEERAEVEEAVLAAARLTREALAEAVRFSRATPTATGYPDEAAEIVRSRERAAGLWQRLKALSPEARLAVVQVAEEFQSWSLCERVCEGSVTEASRDLERAAGLARLAQEIAEHVRDPQGWLNRLRGYALAHVANIVKVQGELKAADSTFEEAKRLWHAGSDPASLLDPGRLFNLEASLRRAQRRFGEALALLEEALAVGRRPDLTLIQKGFTFEVMGEYERAIEALLQAQPLVERQGDRRQMNILHLNLAWDFCHTGRFGEAADLARRVREVATEMGDEILVLRVTWLEGRIAAGLGRSGEARSLLAQARREFAAREMWYDVALALLEEAVLLLGEGRTAVARELARELTKVFESKGVHREALAALRLFQDAAEREAAPADLARRVLGYLFRARYDQGLRFEE